MEERSTNLLVEHAVALVDVSDVTLVLVRTLTRELAPLVQATRARVSVARARQRNRKQRTLG
jgi:hypothetical protein